MARFEFCVSNPPYQRDVRRPGTTKPTAVDIYPEFWLVAHNFAQNVVMIFPRAWTRWVGQKVTSDGVGEVGRRVLEAGTFMVYGFDAHHDTFPGIHNDFSLSILCSDNQPHEMVRVNDSYDHPVSSPLWVTSALQERLLKLREIPVFGAARPAAITATDPGAGVVSRPEAEALLGRAVCDTPADMTDPVAVYLKARNGKQPDGGWFYTERVNPDGSQNLDEVVKHLDRWKVAIRSRIFGRLPIWTGDVRNTAGHVRAEVFGPSVTHSTTWATLRAFDTEQEAANFRKLLSTRLATMILGLDIGRSGFGRFLPDFGDWTNANLLFTPDDDLPTGHPYRGLDTGQRFNKLCGVDEVDEAELIEEYPQGHVLTSREFWVPRKGVDF